MIRQSLLNVTTQRLFTLDIEGSLERWAIYEALEDLSLYGSDFVIRSRDVDLRRKEVCHHIPIK